MSSQQPIISAIAAMSENRVIGNNNQLPWHLPADFKHFKALTTGHPIIMGRKTFASIGKPLPNRTNIIITRDKNFHAAECIVVNSLDAAIEAAQKENTDEVFIIGGAEIYKQSLPLLNRLYLTIIHREFAGDTFFPELDPKIWHEAERVTHDPDEKNQYNYSFVRLERK